MTLQVSNQKERPQEALTPHQEKSSHSSVAIILQNTVPFSQNFLKKITKDISIVCCFVLGSLKVFKHIQSGPEYPRMEILVVFGLSGPTVFPALGTYNAQHIISVPGHIREVSSQTTLF